MSHAPTVILQCQHINKSYNEAKHDLKILNDLSLDVYQGEHLAIVGSSGSGKSTLLHIMGALDKPNTGKVLFEGQDIHAFGESQQALFRNQNLGFVYQFHHLLADFSALENIAMPLLIAKMDINEAKQRAHDLLSKVGLAHREAHRPSQLSGGERQRVAIARALINQPKLVLADEPTGNLDQSNARAIFDLIEELKQSFSTSFVFVTHDLDLASRMDRQLKLVNGQFTGQAG